MKNITKLFMAIVFILAFSFTAFAGSWEYDDNFNEYMYKNSDGTYLMNGTYYIDNNYFWFDSNGIMLRNRYINDETWIGNSGTVSTPIFAYSNCRYGTYKTKSKLYDLSLTVDYWDGVGEYIILSGLYNDQVIYYCEFLNSYGVDDFNSLTYIYSSSYLNTHSVLFMSDYARVNINGRFIEFEKTSEPTTSTSYNNNSYNNYNYSTGNLSIYDVYDLIFPEDLLNIF